jgi:hypothetical protein
MTYYISIAVIGVLITWVVFFSLLGRLPRKFLRRSLVCPSQNTLARVGFVQKEIGWGTFACTDVSSCSLFLDRQFACDKQCLK